MLTVSCLKGYTFNISHFPLIWHILSGSSVQVIIKAKIKVSVYVHPRVVVWLVKYSLPCSSKIRNNFLTVVGLRSQILCWLSGMGVWGKGLLSAFRCCPGILSHMVLSTGNSHPGCLLSSKSAGGLSSTIPSIKEMNSLGQAYPRRDNLLFDWLQISWLVT